MYKRASKLKLGCINFFVKILVTCTCQNSICCCWNYYGVIEEMISGEKMRSLNLNFNVELSHITQVTNSGNFNLIPVTNISSVCISIQCDDTGKIYFANVVNNLELE